MCFPLLLGICESKAFLPRLMAHDAWLTFIECLFGTGIGNQNNNDEDDNDFCVLRVVMQNEELVCRHIKRTDYGTSGVPYLITRTTYEWEFYSNLSPYWHIRIEEISSRCRFVDPLLAHFFCLVVFLWLHDLHLGTIFRSTLVSTSHPHLLQHPFITHSHLQAYPQLLWGMMNMWMMLPMTMKITNRRHGSDGRLHLWSPTVLTTVRMWM